MARRIASGSDGQGFDDRLHRLPAVADNGAMEAELPKTDPPKRKRRWYQFSLRTLMIVVRLFALLPCGYIGWNARIVRDRRAAFKSSKPINWTPGDKSDLSWIRQILGDEVYDQIGFAKPVPAERVEQLAALFPEASIAGYDDPNDPFREPDVLRKRATKP